MGTLIGQIRQSTAVRSQIICRNKTIGRKIPGIRLKMSIRQTGESLMRNLIEIVQILSVPENGYFLNRAAGENGFVSEHLLFWECSLAVLWDR